MSCFHRSIDQRKYFEQFVRDFEVILYQMLKAPEIPAALIDRAVARLLLMHKPYPFNRKGTFNH
jgi:hypothetical protein